jgi:hypothetical protein
MEKALARRRLALTCLQQPGRVLALFAAVCVDGARSAVDWLVHHRAVALYPLLAATAAFAAAAAVPGVNPKTLRP